MKKQENQPAKPTPGCLSVPLFNQKKRNRVPLTSAASENESFSYTEYIASTNSAASHSTPGVYGCYKVSGPSSGASKNQWNRQTQGSQPQQYGSARPAPGPTPTMRNYAFMPHPYKVESTSRPSALAVQPQNSWKFTNSFGPQRSGFEGKRSSSQPQTQKSTQTQQAFPMKPATETSLRILTAVIDGMRHWSQFKDKVPCLFELFATLDSAVTLGHHGAKNFLMRDGKAVVQCVFYENEQELPRLIRGQVHRCVGNYDRNRDVLICVSVRPGLPSELRNSQEAVKACDAEMRALVKSLSEV